jgi:uncharacterized protein YggT (Ycf19 family)
MAYVHRARRPLFHRGVRDEAVVDDGVDTPVVAERSAATTLTDAVWFVAGVILILLAFRFVLSLLGANSTNGFANFIYTTSHPFVAPFFGLFNYNNIQYGISRFEVYTLVAMAVYSAIAWALTALLNIGRRY